MAKKKKKAASKKEKKETEKVCETFEVEKTGKTAKSKEEVKTVCGEIEKKQGSKGEVKRYNKILKTILIIIGALLILFFIALYVINSTRYFDYRGLTGELVQEGDLFFYKVAFPVWYAGNKVPYNIYLRNNPEDLGESIPFTFDTEDGIKFGLKFTDNDMYRLVLNVSGTEENFACEGDKEGDMVIAIANFVNIKAIGIAVMSDPNATCDYAGNGRYMYVNVRPANEGEETEIKQVGPACYELIAKDCDILKVTERFMVEAFVKHAEKVTPLK